jgi:hypothetical protein
MIWPEGDGFDLAKVAGMASNLNPRYSHRTSRVLKNDWRRLCIVERDL